MKHGLLLTEHYFKVLMDSNNDVNVKFNVEVKVDASNIKVQIQMMI